MSDDLKSLFGDRTVFLTWTLPRYYQGLFDGLSAAEIMAESASLRAFWRRRYSAPDLLPEITGGWAKRRHQQIQDLLGEPHGMERDISIAGGGEVAVEIVGGHDRDPITEGFGGRRRSEAVDQQLGQHDFVHRGHIVGGVRFSLQRLKSLFHRLFRHLKSLRRPAGGRVTRVDGGGQ